MLALLALVTAVHAADVTSAHSGRLLDSAGQPITTTADLDIDLLSGGASVWSDRFEDVPIEGGFYAVVLGSGEPLAAQTFADDDLQIRVSIAGVPLSTQPVHSGARSAHASSVTGRVQVDGSATCAQASDAGGLRWTGTTLELCDGAAWVSISTIGPGSGLRSDFAALSCRHIHESYPAQGSGPYWLDPDGLNTGSAPFQAWCDMDTSGGGWTRCLSARYFEGAKPSGWTKETWISAVWQADGRVLDNEPNGTQWGNFCPELAAHSTQMSGEVRYTATSSWSDIRTGPVTIGTFFNSGADGNYTAANGDALGRDSNGTGVYGLGCSSQYNGNTNRGMQSLCIADSSNHQGQHTGWASGQYSSCSDASNQPCYCTPNTYCGGSNIEERFIVTTVYVR